MVFLAALLATAAFLSAAVASPTSLHSKSPAPFSNFNDNTVFVPASNYTSWRTIYARTLQLSNNSLIISWEDYDPVPGPQQYFPIYKSDDGGATWQNYTRVYDQVNGWGLRYQPYFYMLDQAFGGYPAGTILLSGVSTPSDLSQAYIELYASTDNARTWRFVSHIAYGAGPETVTNGNKAVWEPFFYMYNGQLICYYSDQRDSAHAQKLVTVTTKDLKTWSNPVNAVAQPNYGDRPGMATVAYIKSTGKYIMTFEYCGGPDAGGCPAYYKVASSPLGFGSVDVQPIISNDSSKLIPNGSPYVVWTPKPGATDGSGVIIMNGNSREEVFINDDSAGVNGWKAVNVGQWSAYSRSLRIIRDNGKSKLLLANGGNMGCNPCTNNFVAVGVVDIPT
ncbi:hypothetical protein HII31_13287 [Pseudocercospora fuligena]|uniref:Glycoside hydrolase family 93 protein n=1 Tax=Pseudocercospora fuligena TaxID=685502 RepID=A0A8H6VAQ9_9PEZI|nr:hypothetical protein HII31_13287 [Pseudocercospora fuligena]